MTLENIAMNAGIGIINIIQILVFLIFLGIIGFGAYFAIFKYKIFQKFPVIVMIFERRKDNTIINMDRARRVFRPDGQVYYEFKYNKGLGDKLQPQNFENILIDKKGNSYLLLYSPEPNQFFPLTPEFGNPHPKLNIVESDMLFWKTVSDKETIQRWKNKNVIEKLWPVITIGILAVGFILILYGTFEFGIKPVTVATANVADKLGVVADKLATITTQTSSSQPIPIRPPG